MFLSCQTLKPEGLNIPKPPCGVGNGWSGGQEAVLEQSTPFHSRARASKSHVWGKTANFLMNHRFTLKVILALSGVTVIGSLS